MAEVSMGARHGRRRSPAPPACHRLSYRYDPSVAIDGLGNVFELDANHYLRRRRVGLSFVGWRADVHGRDPDRAGRGDR